LSGYLTRPGLSGFEVPRLDTTDRVDRYGGSASTTAASYCIAVTLLSGQRY